MRVALRTQGTWVEFKFYPDTEAEKIMLGICIAAGGEGCKPEMTLTGDHRNHWTNTKAEEMTLTIEPRGS